MSFLILKKLSLSAFVLLCFIAYSFQQRNEKSEVVIVKSVNPTPASSTTTPTTPANQNKPAAIYKDGEYTGSVADAFYGNIQVKAIITSGKITDIIFIDHPNDSSTSLEINDQAMPLLKQEVIQAQTGKVDIVSGATDTSEAFLQSIAAALDQAKI